MAMISNCQEYWLFFSVLMFKSLQPVNNFKKNIQSLTFPLSKVDSITTEVDANSLKGHLGYTGIFWTVLRENVENLVTCQHFLRSKLINNFGFLDSPDQIFSDNILQGTSAGAKTSISRSLSGSYGFTGITYIPAGVGVEDLMYYNHSSFPFIMLLNPLICCLNYCDNLINVLSQLTPFFPTLLCVVCGILASQAGPNPCSMQWRQSHNQS